MLKAPLETANPRRVRANVLSLALQLIAVSYCGARVHFDQSARTIDRFDFVEVTIRVPHPPDGNPFLDAEVTGEFGREGFAPTAHVEGFCDSDDGSLFRIRFMP